MKKILCLFIILSLLFSVSYAESISISDKINLVNELNIMVGDDSGNMNLDNLVSRAEFSKISVAASKYRNMVATNLSISSFFDVPYTEWYAPYVYVAAKNKLVTGYPDSSFKPNDTVTYEEALTVCLKLLGYTDEDFGLSWPYGQIGLAENLKLNNNVEGSQGQEMTRRQVLELIYNMLTTYNKDSNIEYIDLFDYKIIEDVILIATTNEDSSVGSDKIYTSEGTYKINNTFNYENVGKKGDVIIKNGNELVSFIPSVQSINKYNIYQVLDSQLVVMNGADMESLAIDNNLSVYNKSTRSTLKSIYSEISAGDILVTYSNSDGVIDYGIIKTDEMQGPVTYSGKQQIASLGLNIPSVIKDGKKSTMDSLEMYDILYYSKTLNTIWAYTTRISGVYENAIPNKDTPNSVDVSGTNYVIEGTNAFKKLSSNGEINYGDKVTLLLGKDGKIADVLSGNKSGTNNSKIYCYLIDSGTKEFTKTNGETYSALSITVIDSTGNQLIYTSDRDYSNYINQVVSLSISNGVANVSVISQSNNISGKVDAQNYTIGKHNLSKDVKIIDIASTDKLYVSAWKKIYLRRIDTMNINYKNIIAYTQNSKGEIEELFLNNVTGDAWKYGLSKSDRGSSYDLKGTTKSAGGGAKYSVDMYEPVAILTDGSRTSSVKALTKAAGKICDITDEYIENDSGIKSELSDDVSVYIKDKNSNYLYTPLSTIINNQKSYSYMAYIDKNISAGGRVRVIIAYEK